MVLSIVKVNKKISPFLGRFFLANHIDLGFDGRYHLVARELANLTRFKIHRVAILRTSRLDKRRVVVAVNFEIHSHTDAIGARGGERATTENVDNLELTLSAKIYFHFYFLFQNSSKK